MLKKQIFWNKVENDFKSPFGTKMLRGEYELKDQVYIDNTLENLKERFSNNTKMTFYDNCIVEHLGSYYGIRSFSILTEE
jgi:hypothetical protein